MLGSVLKHYKNSGDQHKVPVLWNGRIDAKKKKYNLLLGLRKC